MEIIKIPDSLILPKNFTIQEYLNFGTHSVMPETDRKLLLKEFGSLSIAKQQRNLNVLHALQPIRDKFGKPIFITCGYRSKRHELSRNRSGKSQHLLGAVDITSDDINGLSLMLNDWKGGFKRYKNFIHIDLGPIRRW